MKDSFLDRNKKKSLLAALLLLLRGRKVLVLLLFLVLMASMVFLSPSSWISSLPGGARLEAGVAWLAQKMGVNVSDWGLGGRHSFGELAAFFASQKANAGKGGAGWGAFFTAVDRNGLASRGDTLDLVKGRLSDLEGPKGAAKDAQPGTISGVMTPEQAAKDPDANAVAIDPKDLAGERESWVKSAFAGGFMSGFFGAGAGGANGAGALQGGAGGAASSFGAGGGFGSNGAAALSGGAFAGKGFFNGTGGATTTSNPTAHNGLNTINSVPIPRSKIQGGAQGTMSAARSRAMDLKAISGASNAASLGGNHAFTQLAQGRGLALMATAPDCAPPGCPGEYAATNTGIIYDGTKINDPTTGILIAPQVDGFQAPNLPDAGLAQKYADEAAQMEKDAKKCQDLDAQYGPTETSLNAKMQSISDEFGSAGCGSGGCNKKKAAHCQDLGNQLKATCSQYMLARCAHSHACPLTATVNCSNECEGGDNPTGAAQSKSTPSNTQGNTNGSGMLGHPEDGQ